MVLQCPKSQLQWTLSIVVTLRTLKRGCYRGDLLVQVEMDTGDNLSTKDKKTGPKRVLYSEVPLYVHWDNTLLETVFLHAEYQERPSGNGPPTGGWIITDEAVGKQLGTRQRIKEKEALSAAGTRASLIIL